jgi:hypothetical protein
MKSRRSSPEEKEKHSKSALFHLSPLYGMHISIYPDSDCAFRSSEANLPEPAS